jgi:hypothetical protein
MPRKPDPATRLAQLLLATLEAQRTTSTYPLTLQRLGELAGADPGLLLKAAAKKPFAERAVTARKKDVQAPVALRDDLGQLAASQLLLEFVLDVRCTTAKPAWPIKQLATVLVSELRPPFAEAVRRAVEANALPPTIGTTSGRGGPLLYLQRLPPPPPPPKPEVALAENLLRVLEGQRRLGPASYPLPLRRLVELTDPQASPKLVNRATAGTLFLDRAVVARKKDAEAPVALRVDLTQLAVSSLLLEFMVRRARTAANHAVPINDMKKKLVPALQQQFTDATDRELPATVGCILHKGKWLFFLLEDVQKGEAEAPVDSVLSSQYPVLGTQYDVQGASDTPSDFRRAFDDVFDRLQQRPGADNFVNLLDLRRALPAVDRAAFEAGLRQLRAAGVYSLRLADGRFGISPEERDAGIPTPDGALLLYVSRNTP